MRKSDTRCESKQECSSSKADELKVEFSAEWLRIWRYERGMSLTHFTTFSRSHADMLISHEKKIYFFVFVLLLLVRGLWCTKGTPTTCMCGQNLGKNFQVGKKSVGVPPPPPPPPPAHQLFWDLRDFIGWQRTALAAFFTPNPHPMLAALL